MGVGRDLVGLFGGTTSVAGFFPFKTNDLFLCRADVNKFNHKIIEGLTVPTKYPR